MNRIKISRLVKSEDLNHHGTLFAGRMAEWFVEACFISGARETGKPENIVCVNVHGLTFTTPGNKGDIVNLESYVVKAGKTSFTVYGKITRNNSDKIISDGFITFVFVDENNKSMPHNIVLDEPKDEEEKESRERALRLK
ncbi:hotdog domain-containing protein [Proteiniborus sp. MB09-C3]|uniref:acyl-CoA thioesterase n=1 Tax=Proteiniborus sp. MB09-C3 TaxID=3050072 RepID=UPI00255759A4|nr:hotdog domain-containing protein [Proteiniborus sp. MB09-C3]WIV11707.1 hotdog domain-containing protein [Proteiniborus sp. MB09-C3]